MKQYTSALILILFFQTIAAQTFYDVEALYKQYESVKIQQGTAYTTTLVEGSPHDKSDFTSGSVVVQSNITYANVPLRFNIYTNEMEFQTEDGTTMYLAGPEVFEHIMVGDEKYVYAPYAAGNRMLRSYFKVLAEGEATLLSKQNIILKDAEPPAAYKEAQPARFMRMPDDFYIRKAPAEAFKVSNRKELLSVLSDKGKYMEDFIRKNRIRYNRPEDLVKLTEFYNSLD